MADRDTLPPDAPDALQASDLEVVDPATLHVEGLRARAILGERAHVFARVLGPLAELGPFVLVLAELPEATDDGGLAICTQTNVHRDEVAASILRAALATWSKGAADV